MRFLSSVHCILLHITHHPTCNIAGVIPIQWFHISGHLLLSECGSPCFVSFTEFGVDRHPIHFDFSFTSRHTTAKTDLLTPLMDDFVTNEIPIAQSISTARAMNGLGSDPTSTKPAPLPAHWNQLLTRVESSHLCSSPTESKKSTLLQTNAVVYTFQTHLLHALLCHQTLPLCPRALPPCALSPWNVNTICEFQGDLHLYYMFWSKKEDI